MINSGKSQICVMVFKAPLKPLRAKQRREKITKKEQGNQNRERNHKSSSKLLRTLEERRTSIPSSRGPAIPWPVSKSKGS
jgi:hypothetical protein